MSVPENPAAPMFLHHPDGTQEYLPLILCAKCGGPKRHMAIDGARPAIWYRCVVCGTDRGYGGRRA